MNISLLRSPPAEGNASGSGGHVLHRQQKRGISPGWVFLLEFFWEGSRRILDIWPWVKTSGTILEMVGAPPILEPILVGIGMFTGEYGLLTNGHMFAI